MLNAQLSGGMATGLNNLMGTWYTKSTNKIAAYQKWEAETLKAIRAGLNQDKANFRAHEVDMKNWKSQSTYTEELKKYENKLSADASRLKTETSQNAMEALGRRYADLDARFYEEEATAQVQLETIRLKSISDSVKVISGGQVGRSVERIHNTYHQQYLDNASNKQITSRFRIGDKLAAHRAGIIEAQNKANSVSFYNPRPYKDPIQPEAPIPTDVYTAPEPKASSALTLMDFMGAAGAGLNNYVANSPRSSRQMQSDVSVKSTPTYGNDPVDPNEAAAWAEDHGRSIEDANAILIDGQVETVIG